MGITFLAAGTSVPDCIASLIVARQGTHQSTLFFVYYGVCACVDIEIIYVHSTADDQGSEVHISTVMITLTVLSMVSQGPICIY